MPLNESEIFGFIQICLPNNLNKYIAERISKSAIQRPVKNQQTQPYTIYISKANSECWLIYLMLHSCDLVSYSPSHCSPNIGIVTSRVQVTWRDFNNSKHNIFYYDMCIGLIYLFIFTVLHCRKLEFSNNTSLLPIISIREN